MNSKYNMKQILVVLTLLTLSVSSYAVNFTVTDIRLEGLQRVSASPVFAAMPVRVGDSIDSEDVREVIRSIFATGYFTNVQVARDGNDLVVILQERPAIKSIEFDGNKAIKTEQLEEVMTENGIAEGEILQRHMLQQITRELERQYIGQSRYSANVEAVVEDLANNMVAIKVEVDEGKAASILHFNIVGNEIFSDEELFNAFELRESVWWKFFSKADQYSREKLSGDIEKLESFYLDRGYLDFKVLSSQVSVSPDKESVYITLNIKEGGVYTVKDLDIAGDPILPEERVRRLILLRKGETFSQILMTDTAEYIKTLLGNAGYTNATVEGIPEKNPEDNTVVVNFLIDPGKRVYVRRVEFRGNTKSSDEVLRREMRQHEGASASNARIEQSKVRLERLGFFKEVTVENKDVPGTDDLIDVEFTVEEQPSGQIQASIGYAQYTGLNLALNIQENNWLGTGKQVNFGINKNTYQTIYNFGYNDPYFTPDGVSRGFSAFYRTRDYSRLRVAEYATDSFGGNLNFGYPISEIERIGFGVGIDHQSVTAGSRAAAEILTSPVLRSGSDASYITQTDYSQYIASGLLDENGIPVEYLLDSRPVEQDMLLDVDEGFINKYGDQFLSGTVNFNWTRMTLNRGVLATRGSSQRFSVEATIPGSDLQYYKFNYEAQAFVPLSRFFTLRFKTTLGYGDGYGKMEHLPFFENFYAGGFGSVRGFERSTLGPKGTPPRAYSTTHSGWIDLNRNGQKDNPTYVDTNGNGIYDEDEFFNEYVGYNSTYILCDNATYCEPGKLMYSSTSGGFINTRENAIGGNVLTEFTTELLLPIPFIEDTRSMQLVAFVDAGNVFSTDCGSEQIGCSNVDFEKLSSSAGIGFTWISGFGPMTFSVAKALHENEFDSREVFQFSFGSGF